MDMPEPGRGFSWVTGSHGATLRCDALAGVAAHLFTTRARRLKGDEAVREWGELAEALGHPAGHLVLLKQVHGRIVVEVDAEDAASRGPDGERPEADAALTDRLDRVLAVQTADCVPVLLADRHRRFVAAVHAGWRGCATGVLEATVAQLATHGAAPGDLLAAIGPSIGPCCYEVGLEVREACCGGEREGVGKTAGEWFVPSPAGRPDRLHLDLWRASRDQLLHAGLPAQAIHAASLCTRCHPGLFWSYRREGGAAGRMAAAICRSGQVPRA
jgi:YfiH family protein